MRARLLLTNALDPRHILDFLVNLDVSHLGVCFIVLVSFFKKLRFERVWAGFHGAKESWSTRENGRRLMNNTQIHLGNCVSAGGGGWRVVWREQRHKEKREREPRGYIWLNPTSKFLSSSKKIDTEISEKTDTRHLSFCRSFLHPTLVLAQQRSCSIAFR